MTTTQLDLPDRTRQDESSVSSNGSEQPSHIYEGDANGQINDEEKKDSTPMPHEDGGPEGNGPEGGFDSTPIPCPPSGVVGYTVKIKFHRAFNLAIGDAHVLSSDPYVLAQINTGLPTRHKEDPKLRFRTQTIRKDTDPVWDEEWIVANVPSSGFKLKIRVYDEDPADHDDILGKVHVNVPSLSDDWSGTQNEQYKLRVRDSSKRSVLIRAVATSLRLVEHFRGELYLSISILGRTGEDGQNGRLYTVGPCRWVRHYSPLLGRIANVKEDDNDYLEQHTQDKLCKYHKDIRHYNFQANQMQLPGPVPAQLYHRFVEFKPWVKRMFTTSGFQGVVLGKALHHQHTRVYNFGRTTLWGYFPQGACIDMTKQFLDLVHHDKGGRIFTYVLTLDALFRFTETGKEFGIDMLSKHTMHSDVSIYIAFSGEFFIRRRKHRHRLPSSDPREGTDEHLLPERSQDEAQELFENETSEDDPPQDPSNYELIIDNDSGTYRPNAEMLPLLASFLSASLPGLHIRTLDCQADADKMTKLKDEQRERKKREGDNIIYTQGSDSSSISSSEDERLDEIQAAYEGDGDPARYVSEGDGSSREHGTLEQVTKDQVLQHKSRMEKMQGMFRGKDSEEHRIAARGGRV